MKGSCVANIKPPVKGVYSLTPPGTFANNRRCGPDHVRGAMAERISPLAGKPLPSSMLVNVPKLTAAYFLRQPDPAVPTQRVAFGTSGHRGSAFDTAFNEAHILAA